jgi:predicted transport protein
MPLFNIDNSNRVQRFRAGAYDLEKQLQQIIQMNLEEIFGVKLVASEFSVRGEQPGRIDTLGLDYEGAPTIIEYKRDKNENVINQGLYYMNWLLDHRGDFVVAAREMLGSNIEINWSHPRLIVIAQSYAKWDTYAVNRMGEGIELWEYVRYGDNLLYLNQVYGQQRNLPPKLVEPVTQVENQLPPEPSYTLQYHTNGKPIAVQRIFEELRQGIFALAKEEGEIIETPNKLYVSYRHGKNFCEVQLMSKGLKLHLDLPASELSDPLRITRDVSGVGHWGTGQIEVKIAAPEDIQYVLSLIEQSYRMTL